MQTEVALFFLHCVAFAAFCLLFRTAPCWIQKMVVVLLALAMLMFAFGDVGVVFALLPQDDLTTIGYALEHLGVLLYLFRLQFQGESWRRLSRYSRS